MEHINADAVGLLDLKSNPEGLAFSSSVCVGVGEGMRVVTSYESLEREHSSKRMYGPGVTLLPWPP